MTDATTETATTPASEAASSTSGDVTDGSAVDGSGDGSQPAADTFAQERAALEQRARQEQARADRLQAELDKVRKPAAPTEPAAGLTLDQLRAEQKRWRELEAEATALRASDSVKFADRSLFDRADEFDSVEAFRAAVETSHRSNEATITALGLVPKSDVDAQLQAYREKYGALETPPDAGGATPTGDPTVEQIRAMSFTERDAFDKENPGVIARVLRSAMKE